MHRLGPVGRNNQRVDGRLFGPSGLSFLHSSLPEHHHAHNGRISDPVPFHQESVATQASGQADASIEANFLGPSGMKLSIVIKSRVNTCCGPRVNPWSPQRDSMVKVAYRRGWQAHAWLEQLHMCRSKEFCAARGRSLGANELAPAPISHHCPAQDGVHICVTARDGVVILKTTTPVFLDYFQMSFHHGPEAVPDLYFRGMLDSGARTLEIGLFISQRTNANLSAQTRPRTLNSL